jgi:hypothetical protein
MFDKTHENPELIWNDKIRQKVLLLVLLLLLLLLYNKG